MCHETSANRTIPPVECAHPEPGAFPRPEQPTARVVGRRGPWPVLMALLLVLDVLGGSVSARAWSSLSWFSPGGARLEQPSLGQTDLPVRVQAPERPEDVQAGAGNERAEDQGRFGESTSRRRALGTSPCEDQDKELGELRDAYQRLVLSQRIRWFFFGALVFFAGWIVGFSVRRRAKRYSL